VTVLVLAVVVFVVFSLGQALFAMSSGPDESGRVVKALTRRIALSVLLFAGLMLGWKLGLITPHGR
jgi:hypothetical protein